MTYRKMTETPSLKSLLTYCPQIPWPKQLTFLTLNCKEILYGGSAGPGKSSALLMAALQYVHVPRYSALILRKDSQRLRLSGGLIPRSHEWFAKERDKTVAWNDNDKRWTFECPGGGQSFIQFGYLDSTNDKYRYGSSEYQYIGFDELTEFPEEDYLFMFSRLRKTLDIHVPYRMYSASNPGGPYGDWVRARFVPQAAEEDRRAGKLKDVYYTEAA